VEISPDFPRKLPSFWCFSVIFFAIQFSVNANEAKKSVEDSIRSAGGRDLNTNLLVDSIRSAGGRDLNTNLLVNVPFAPSIMAGSGPADGSSNLPRATKNMIFTVICHVDVLKMGDQRFACMQ